jgi:hypothetical protein
VFEGDVIAFALAAKIERHTQSREGRSQLVRDVGEKLALLLNEALDPFSHSVEILH